MTPSWLRRDTKVVFSMPQTRIQHLEMWTQLIAYAWVAYQCMLLWTGALTTRHVTLRYLQPSPGGYLARQLLCKMKNKVHHDTSPRNWRSDPLQHRHTRAIFAVRCMHNHRALGDITERYIKSTYVHTVISNGVDPTSSGSTLRRSTLMSTLTTYVAY